MTMAMVLVIKTTAFTLVGNMNERIKSLLAKAHLDVMEDLGDIDTNHVAEKFAELIVKECIDAALEAQADFYIVHNIRTRLGVE